MRRTHLDVLFRSCSRVVAVHSETRLVPKHELLIRCLASVVTSLTHATQQVSTLSVTLTILDDHSDAQTLTEVSQILASCPFPAQTVALAVTGNGPSLRENYLFAREHCQDLIYFVEDDYLHAPSALLEVVEAHCSLTGRLGRDIVIFPCDYPDRYDDPYPSLIVRSAIRYWRSVLHTTGTFLITRAQLERDWERYLAFARIGLEPGVTEDATINQIYREVQCFAPMPSLAIHLQKEADLSPFIDWRHWWDAAKPKA